MTVTEATLPTIFIPIVVIAGCIYVTPFVAVFGALHGGSDSDAAKANRAAKAARKREVEALRPVIESALATVATDNALHTRLLEAARARTHGKVLSVTEPGPTSPRKRPRYKELRSRGIDTVLEVTVPRLDVSAGNAFVLNARVRLIRIADSTELRASTHTFEIAPRSVSEWIVDGGATLRAALVGGYQKLADKIADDLFSPPPPSRDPVHTSP